MVFSFRRFAFASLVALAGLLLIGLLLICLIYQESDFRAQVPAKRINKTALAPPTPASLRASLAALPLRFEENKGQADSQVKFISRGHGGTVFLVAREIVLALATARNDSHFLRIKLPGKSPPAKIIGLKQLPGESNYFVGNHPARWRTHVPLYGMVEYAGILPGVSLAFYGRKEELEFDLVVAAYSDPGRIVFQLEGAAGLKLDHEGNLLVRAGKETLQLRRPALYQPIGDEHRSVEGGFVLVGKHSIGFRIGAYDRSQPLVIDPTLVYATYLGGSAADNATGVAVDSSGKVYLAGSTESTDFPTSPTQTKPGGAGNYDVFVTKMDTTQSGAASLVYSTYLGGSSDDLAFGLAVDSSGDAVVTGSTVSSDFPVLNAFQATLNGTSDLFVTKFNPSGSGMMFSSYFGGSSTEGTGGSGAIAVDGSQNIYVTSDTESSDLYTSTNAYQPTLRGLANIFVTEFSPAGAVLYSTYFGGSVTDTSTAVVVDAASVIYVAGYTTSPDFPVLNECPTLPAAYSGSPSDAFALKLDPSQSTTTAQLIYSVYLGGDDQDRAWAIAVDTASPPNAYVTGDTLSANFPVTSANGYQTVWRGGQDAFVTVLGINTSKKVCDTYSTFFGGSANDSGRGIAVNSSGKIYITGSTSSEDFPVLDAFQATYAGMQDAFAAKFDPSSAGLTSLLYSTYLGGSASDSGAAISIDNQGNAYVTGQTLSSNFPATSASAFQPACASCSSGAGSLADAFLAQISDSGGGPAVNFDPAQGVMGQVSVGSSGLPLNIDLANVGNAPLNVGQIAISGNSDFSQSNNCPSSLPAGGAFCSITVMFMPTSAGVETATLGVSDDAANNPQALSLTGTGVAPAAVASPGLVDFGNQPQGIASPGIPVTLTNAGNAPLTIGSINFAGTNGGDFGPISDNCPVAPGTLAGMSACVVTVVFTPAATGQRTGQLTFADNSENNSASLQTILLTGMGTPPAPIASLLPTSQNFGGVNVGTTSSPANVTLKNSGNLTLHVAQIQMLGNTDFALVAPSSSPCTLGAASQLAPNTSCNLAVNFKPSAAGAETAQIQATDDSGNVPGSVQVTAVTGTGAAPVASVPSTLAVGTQLVSTTGAADALALSNTGTGPLSFQTSFSGSNPGDFFETDTCGANVIAGATCNLMISFTPSAVGARSANLVLTDNSNGIPKSQQIVAITGTGTDFALQPASGSSTSISIAAGQTATYQLEIAPSNGFTGTVGLVCGTAPPLATCSPSSPTVTVTSASPATFQVAIVTTALVPQIRWPGARPPWLLLAAFGIAIFVRISKRRRVLASLALVLSLCLITVSCGGAGGGGGGTDPPTGTPTGTYTVTVNGGVSTASRTISLSLNVN